MRQVVRLVKVAAVCIGLTLVTLIFFEVLSRFVFDFSISVINGLARMLLLWFLFLGASLALRENNHVGLTLLSDGFDGRVKTVSRTLSGLATSAFLILLFIGSISLTHGAWGMTEPSLGISVFWLYLSIPVGTGLMLLFLLEAIVCSCTITPEVKGTI